MLVDTVQATLQSHYDLAIPYAVNQFVSHDSDLAEYLADDDVNDEALLVRQSSDSLEFTLYLDNSVLDQASLSSNKQSAIIEDSLDSLDSLCTVVEGVSHAVCLLWHAHHDRQLRPLDLELQAEIDKYLYLMELVSNPSERGELHRRLFEQISYIAPEGTALHERYRTASDSAASYCTWLTNTFVDQPDPRGLSSELARFYRLSGSAKFQRIQQVH